MNPFIFSILVRAVVDPKPLTGTFITRQKYTLKWMLVHRCAPSTQHVLFGKNTAFAEEKHCNEVVGRCSYC